ncbi:glycerophosphocholine acyltransferase 1 [Aplysia californica]|uniref:Glycerophosphocholine acyltransferase 1 n=1 Tax=Aplysia californica TaxID=6500 RepID=A0ABM0K4G9_APLCA|nr:glycerophosphocholine acyltransferase 1 [Aplysia californica]
MSASHAVCHMDSRVVSPNGVDASNSAVPMNGSIPQPTEMMAAVEKENGCESTTIQKDERGKMGRNSLKQDMQELYESVTDPIEKTDSDVKDFFKVLKNHSLMSKVVYVMTVVSIVVVSHFVLAVQWLLPYYYSIATPVLLLSRLVMYWKMKYQYFLLDFCYFANIYWYTYIWVIPSREDIFAVGFAVANGPLIWALFVFRNSLVFHSLDKVTSLYIHVLPSLMSFVIRWYPEETGKYWYKDFPQCHLGVSFVWLVAVPFGFAVSHQIFYGVLVNLVLKPSEEYLILYRYVTSDENSFMFRACNLLGSKFRFLLYTVWWLALVLGMLFFNLIWYNYFAAHCALLVTFLIVAFFNGSTYYIDVFRFQGPSKSKSIELLSPEEGTVIFAKTDSDENNVTVVPCTNGIKGYGSAL